MSDEDLIVRLLKQMDRPYHRARMASATHTGRIRASGTKCDRKSSWTHRRDG